MIVSFRDTWLRNFYLHDMYHKNVPAVIAERLFRKLQLIDDAVSDKDLRSPLIPIIPEDANAGCPDWQSLRFLQSKNPRHIV